MSGIQKRTKIHFIVALLVHAIADVDFNSHKVVWITSHALLSALNMHYRISAAMNFALPWVIITFLFWMGLYLEQSILNNLNWTHPNVYKCTHRPKRGRRSTLFFMETFESSSAPDTTDYVSFRETTVYRKVTLAQLKVTLAQLLWQSQNWWELFLETQLPPFDLPSLSHFLWCVFRRWMMFQRIISTNKTSCIRHNF